MAAIDVVTAYERLTKFANESGKACIGFVTKTQLEWYEWRKEDFIKKCSGMKEFLNERLDVILIILANNLTVEIQDNITKTEYLVKFLISASIEHFENINEKILAQELLTSLLGLTQRIAILELNVTKTYESCPLNELPMLEISLIARFK